MSIGEKVLQRAHIAEADSSLISQVVSVAVRLVRDCRTNPVPEDVRQLAKNPKRIYYLAVRRLAMDTLGREGFRQLGGDRLLICGFQEVSKTSDAELSELLQEI